MPSDFRLYPLALPDSETGNLAGSSNPLEGRIAILEALVRQGAVQSRKSLRDALALSGIPDVRGRLQALSVSSGSGSGGGSPSPSPSPSSSPSPSPSPSPEPSDLISTIVAVKARLPLAQYSQSKIVAIESFITTLWNGGVWQRLTRLFVNVAPTSAAALTCWKSGVLLSGGSGALTPWQGLDLPTGVMLACPIPGMNPLDFHFFGRSKDGIVRPFWYPLPGARHIVTAGPVVQMGDWLSAGNAFDVIGLDMIGLNYQIMTSEFYGESYVGRLVIRQHTDLSYPDIFFDGLGGVSAVIVQTAQNAVRVGGAHCPVPPIINESLLNAPRTHFRIHGHTIQSSHRRWFASSMGNALTDQQGGLLSEQIETLVGALRG